LQNFMFERFLERLSWSEYRQKFVIKGGMPPKQYPEKASDYIRACKLPEPEIQENQGFRTHASVDSKFICNYTAALRSSSHTFTMASVSSRQ